MSETIAVAMSGGVDSSVAAAMLKERGFDVIGVGMRLFDEPGFRCSTKSCCGSTEMDDARRVAEKMDFPFYVFDMTCEFREHVIDYFVSSYVSGRTPNPCVPCNEVLKFDILLAAARRLGASGLATGHYARSAFDESRGRYVLTKGADASKDQSYFLYSLSQDKLARALFPLGDMTKDETRASARKAGLEVHDKAESQDICFTGEDGYAEFVRERAGTVASAGPILNEEGAEIGRHKGLYLYTVGQRRGLGISTPEALYVIDIDPDNNSITVAPAGCLARQERLSLDNMNYVSVPGDGGPIEGRARTRYRRPEVDAVLTPGTDGTAVLQFATPQEPTAPGQSVVLYGGDLVLCGGTASR